MTRRSEPRVAVYFDFDNIVISRYDQLHGRGAFRRDTSGGPERSSAAPRERLRSSHLDIDAVLDYATSFGSLTLCRAYADWSHPVNAGYRADLTARAVDLVQLFPLSVRRKNGADIRLAVDAMEDLFLLDDVTHVVIVAGDSDYVALAQKARRLGRYVVGIGVTGGTSRALTGACDEYADYDALLTDALLSDDGEEEPSDPEPTVTGGRGAGAGGGSDAAASRGSAGPGAGGADPSGADAGGADGSEEGDDAEEPDGAPGMAGETGGGRVLARRRPGPLLRKALLLLEAKADEEWQSAGAVKNQMLRMDPSFQERELGFSTFTEFVKAYPGVAELDEGAQNRIRRRPGSQ